MASRNNPYQRDPALAKAFDNIASLFAPPSGSDAAGFAAAGLNNQKRKQIEEFYRMATDPNSGREVVDRYGVAAGVYNPTQSYYKIGVDSADARRGQDVTAGTARENNIRDNARAMATTRYGAISEGQILPEMPASVAGMYGLPAAPAQTGIVKLGQNQTATMPDGTTTTGINRPQTMDEWQAQQAERQRLAGALPDTSITDLIMGRQSPVTVKGHDGRTVYAAPGTAMRQGLEAAAAPSSTPAKRSEGMAIINGQRVPVTRDPAALEWQLPDGSPVPPGAQVMDMPKPQGSLEQVGATTANNTEGNRLAASIIATEDLLGQYENILKTNPGIIGLPGAIRGTAQDAVSTIAELGGAFGNLAPDAKLSLDEVQRLAERVSPTRDPNIQYARSLAMSLAYQDAQLQNPSGEVSRQAFERSYEKMTGGMLRNNQSALESVQAMRMLLDAKRKQVGALRQPGATPSAPPAAPATRLRFDANGNPI